MTLVNQELLHRTASLKSKSTLKHTDQVRICRFKIGAVGTYVMESWDTVSCVFRMVRVWYVLLDTAHRTDCSVNDRMLYYLDSATVDVGAYSLATQLCFLQVFEPL